MTFKPTIKKTLPVIDAQINDSDDDLLNQELPAVTDTSDDFIQDDIETPSADFNETTEAEKYRGNPDGKGKPYDPLIHFYPPEQTATGRWKKLPKSETQKKASETESNAGYRNEAQKLALLWAQLHQIPFGAHGALDNMNSLIPMIDDLERYMLENGKTDIPAGLSVLISTSLYSLGVCQREPNAAKLKRWFSPSWNWIRSKFGFGKKDEIEKKDNAQSDSR